MLFTTAMCAIERAQVTLFGLCLIVGTLAFLAQVGRGG